MNKNFISQLLQIFSFISAIAIAFSQYLFKDSFRVFFGENQSLYSLSSLIALILSITIMITLFSNRYYLSNKFYFSAKKKEDYYEKLRNNNQGNSNVSSENMNSNVVEEKKKEKVYEPFFITIKSIAIAFIFIALIVCVIFLNTNNLVVKSIVYIIFICSTVSTISTFAIGLYLENDYKQRQAENESLVLERIREYFAGNFRIKQCIRDDSNWMAPLKKFIIDKDGEEYNIWVNANDPNLFFNAIKIIKN